MCLSSAGGRHPHSCLPCLFGSFYIGYSALGAELVLFSHRDGQVVAGLELGGESDFVEEPTVHTSLHNTREVEYRVPLTIYHF